MNRQDCNRCIYHGWPRVPNESHEQECLVAHKLFEDMDKCPQGVQLPLIDGVPARWGIPREEVKI